MARWLDIAWADQGVTEIAGAEATPEILAYFRDAGRADIVSDEVPWCAAFVGACLARAGVADGLTAHQRVKARAYLKVGTPIDVPRPGAIAVFNRGDNPKAGHVGFVVGATPTHIVLLGGNQANTVSVIHMPKARLLGLRWPRPVAPATVAASRTLAAARKVKREGVAAGAAVGSNAVLPPLVPDVKLLNATAEHVSTWQASLQALSSFASYLVGNWWLVSLLLAGFFLVRVVRESDVIAWLRAEDEASGAHADRSAEETVDVETD